VFTSVISRKQNLDSANTLLCPVPDDSALQSNTSRQRTTPPGQLFHAEIKLEKRTILFFAEKPAQKTYHAAHSVHFWRPHSVHFWRPFRVRQAAAKQKQYEKFSDQSLTCF
jgi:hypothetical protein